MTQQITREQARRFLLTKHGLFGPTPFIGAEGILAYVRQTGCVQYDPVDVCGRSHELALLTRVKGFTRDLLDELLYEKRVLLDYWDKNMSLVLTEDWPYFEPMRQYFRQESRSQEMVEAVRPQVLAHLREKGHTTSQELPVEGKTDWYWSPTNLSRAALETLYFRGELVVHHKRHTVKSYALAEDLLPPEILAKPNPCQTQADHQAWQALRRIGAVGMLWNKPSDAWLGMEGFKAQAREQAFARLLAQEAIAPVMVEGLAHPLYIQSADLTLLSACGIPYQGKRRAHFVPPLDCLLWDRKLIAALFDFAYTWEIYTPESKRTYSYYVLPVLYGDRFAGRVEPICDRKGKTLVMKRFWREKAFRVTEAFRRALAMEAEVLAAFHGLAEIRWEDGFWENAPMVPALSPTDKQRGETKKKEKEESGNKATSRKK